MPRPNGFAVLGTDTGVGKTIVTAGLLRSYVRNGYIAFPQKWVSTGDRFGFSEDMSFVLDVAGLEPDVLVSEDVINPYSFVMPASPHLAAKGKNKRRGIGLIKKRCRLAMESCERLIVEGVGGVLVPLTGRAMLIDVVRETGLPVLLVVKNVLGCINHSLLSIEAIRNRGIRLLGVVFNNAFDVPANIKKDNMDVICRIGRARNLGIVPYMGYLKDYDDIFDVIMQSIEQVL